MYEKAILLKPDDPYAHYYLGVMYIKKGGHRGIYELKQAIKLKPNLAAAHNDLAVAYASMNPPRWKEADKEAKIAKALGYKVTEGLLKLIRKHRIEKAGGS